MIPSQDWIDDCEHWRGRLLTGAFAHWCHDWDGLPIDETTMEWPCACADELMLWKLATEHWPLTPAADLDSIVHPWYTLGMPLHIRFVCSRCKRVITGCPKSCPEPTHKTELVESCAVCGKPPKDDAE